MKSIFRRTMTALLSAGIFLSSAGAMRNRSSVTAEVIENPVISRDCPAYSGTSPYTAGAANDAFYYSSWCGTAPDYLAYDLSAVAAENRQTILAAWYNATGQYDYSAVNGGSTASMPTAYTVEVNAAAGGTYPEDGWEVVETVTDNVLHSRQHVIDFAGYNWIRLMFTESDGKTGATININMDIHNVSDGVTDSWIFFGDSITACGMMNCYGTGFAEYVNQIDSRYFPAQENGGIGGIRSTDGRDNIDRWLSTFPGEYVSIAYGTNDAWGNQTGADAYYENTVYMIEQVLALGKTPILPKIPYATEEGVNAYLDSYNAMVEKIYDTYPQVIKGPDFDALFRENPDLLSGDGVHPSDAGYTAMRQLWAETMYERVYTAEGGDVTDPTITPGDIDQDGSITIKDVHRLSDYLVRRDSYTLTIDKFVADINQDGVVNVFDLALLKQKLMNNE